MTANPKPVLIDATTVPDTVFLIRFAPSSGVGTYSYTISPSVRDMVESTVATNISTPRKPWPTYRQFLQSQAVGGTGIPADDDSFSTTNVVAAANQVIQDVKVLVSLNYPSVKTSRSSSLALTAKPPSRSPRAARARTSWTRPSTIWPLETLRRAPRPIPATSAPTPRGSRRGVLRQKPQWHLDA